MANFSFNDIIIMKYIIGHSKVQDYICKRLIQIQIVPPYI